MWKKVEEQASGSTLTFRSEFDLFFLYCSNILQAVL